MTMVNRAGKRSPPLAVSVGRLVLSSVYTSVRLGRVISPVILHLQCPHHHHQRGSGDENHSTAGAARDDCRFSYGTHSRGSSAVCRTVIRYTSCTLADTTLSSSLVASPLRRVSSRFLAVPSQSLPPVASTTPPRLHCSTGLSAITPVSPGVVDGATSSHTEDGLDVALPFLSAALFHVAAPAEGPQRRLASFQAGTRDDDGVVNHHITIQNIDSHWRSMVERDSRGEGLQGWREAHFPLFMPHQSILDAVFSATWLEAVAKDSLGPGHTAAAVLSGRSERKNEKDGETRVPSERDPSDPSSSLSIVDASPQLFYRETVGRSKILRYLLWRFLQQPQHWRDQAEEMIHVVLTQAAAAAATLHNTDNNTEKMTVGAEALEQGEGGWEGREPISAFPYGAEASSQALEENLPNEGGQHYRMMCPTDTLLWARVETHCRAILRREPDHGVTFHTPAVSEKLLRVARRLLRHSPSDDPISSVYFSDSAGGVSPSEADDVAGCPSAPLLDVWESFVCAQRESADILPSPHRPPFSFGDVVHHLNLADAHPHAAALERGDGATGQSQPFPPTPCDWRLGTDAYGCQRGVNPSVSTPDKDSSSPSTPHISTPPSARDSATPAEGTMTMDPQTWESLSEADRYSYLFGEQSALIARGRSVQVDDGIFAVTYGFQHEWDVPDMHAPLTATGTAAAAADTHTHTHAEAPAYTTRHMERIDEARVRRGRPPGAADQGTPSSRRNPYLLDDFYMAMIQPPIPPPTRTTTWSRSASPAALSTNRADTDTEAGAAAFGRHGSLLSRSSGISQSQKESDASPTETVEPEPVFVRQRSRRRDGGSSRRGPVDPLLPPPPKGWLDTGGMFLNVHSGLREDAQLALLWQAFAREDTAVLLAELVHQHGRGRRLGEELLASLLSQASLLLLFFSRPEVRAIVPPVQTFQYVWYWHETLCFLAREVTSVAGNPTGLEGDAARNVFPSFPSVTRDSSSVGGRGGGSAAAGVGAAVCGDTVKKHAECSPHEDTSLAGREGAEGVALSCDCSPLHCGEQTPYNRQASDVFMRHAYEQFNALPERCKWSYTCFGHIHLAEEVLPLLQREGKLQPSSEDDDHDGGTNQAEKGTVQKKSSIDPIPVGKTDLSAPFAAPPVVVEDLRETAPLSLSCVVDIFFKREPDVVEPAPPPSSPPSPSLSSSAEETLLARLKVQLPHWMLPLPSSALTSHTEDEIDPKSLASELGRQWRLEVRPESVQQPIISTSPATVLSEREGGSLEEQRGAEESRRDSSRSPARVQLVYPPLSPLGLVSDIPLGSSSSSTTQWAEWKERKKEGDRAEEQQQALHHQPLPSPQEVATGVAEEARIVRKRGRGRPRKVLTSPSVSMVGTSRGDVDDEFLAVPLGTSPPLFTKEKKRGRGRPRKVAVDHPADAVSPPSVSAGLQGMNKEQEKKKEEEEVEVDEKLVQMLIESVLAGAAAVAAGQAPATLGDSDSGAASPPSLHTKDAAPEFRREVKMSNVLENGAPKRGRGRPRKQPMGSGIEARVADDKSAASVAVSCDAGSGVGSSVCLHRRGPGRPKGSRNRFHRKRGRRSTLGMSDGGGAKTSPLSSPAPVLSSSALPIRRRRRGRPRKVDEDSDIFETIEDADRQSMARGGEAGDSDDGAAVKGGEISTLDWEDSGSW